MIRKALALLFAVCVLTSTVGAQENKKVICFIGHRTSHGFGNHEYHAGNHLIGEWLEKAYPGQTESRYSVNWPKNEDEFFAGADTVVFFCSGGRGHLVNNHVPNFDKVMKTGAGLVCLHYGVEVPIGPSGKGMLNWMGGYFEAHWSVNPHWIAEFKVFPGHEAANGIKPFKADDEWYFHMRFRENMKGVTPILSAIAPDETMKRGDGAHSGNPTVREAVAAKKPQHVAWTYQRDADYNHGRGFGFTGLHYHWNWEDDSFRKTVLNGVAWTLKLPIPENGVESKRPTREELEANAAEHGGEQNRKPKPKPNAALPKANPNTKALWKSQVVTELTPGMAVEVDVEIPAGSKELYLAVTDVDGYSFDWANWVEPRLVMTDGSEKKLTDLNWKSATSGWGNVQKNKNVKGAEQIVGGKKVAYGIGVHANSIVAYDLPAGVKRFKAQGGIDQAGSEQSGSSTVQFHVFNQNPGNVSGERSSGGGGTAESRDAADAVASLDVHDDLKVQLFASEPMMLSPSAIDIDHRGRIWVCEVVNYRRNQGKRPEGDRIVILEDTDGDAKADKSTVFYQGADIDSAHGICVLGDRVIISAGDDVFSLYDRNGDDKADEGSKEMMFTKIGGKQHDHGIHAVHFGPDGRLYFNFGNAGRKLHDAEGNIVIDKAGNEVRGGNLPYQEGMVFRCELDGSGVETLGWNFRNNWEIAVDSYGTVWQSDNDDDGNKAVRINYVMEFGNYGYKDERTRAGWRDARPNIEEEIPLRHWHLNDPGVVPNLLQTGQGSPTGICVYEGHLLPEEFHGQPIHCDAGPNVVRAYPSEPDGGGYRAETINILQGARDKWFRPSDVAAAPDGSLFVADWYDPGVGGHAMRDLEKGRIFRVTTEEALKYQTDNYAGQTRSEANKSGAANLLNSPNEAARYLAFQELLKGGKASIPWLQSQFNQGDPHHRARALWLLGRLEGASFLIDTALVDNESNLRITALRAIRQLFPGQLLLAVEKLADDEDAGVRRECAIALRFDGSAKANDLWAKLARNHKAGDRWALEALGIGADLHWDARLAALENPSEDILWRSRGKDSAQKLADKIVASPENGARNFRAIHFQDDNEAQKAAYRSIFLNANQELALLAASQLGNDVKKLEGGQARLDSLVGPIRGKAEFVKLVEKLGLRGFSQELVDYIVTNPDTSEAVTAAKLLLNDRGPGQKVLQGNDQSKIGPLAAALGKTGDRRATQGWLSGVLRRKETSAATKKAIVNGMILSSQGGKDLIELFKKGQLDDSLKTVAALGLARSPDGRVRNDAAQVLPAPKAQGAENLPSISELAKLKGDASKGSVAYAKAGCVACHRVSGQFIDFGPELTEIGKKLSKEAMFESILHPSVGISHGFHGVTLTKKTGEAFAGYVTGETDDEVTIRLPGGVSQAIPTKEIKTREDMELSLMPPGLAAALTKEELTDLVAYLLSLK